MLIDHHVTARVFNLPETAIPDDIKYVGNLVHRNLIRSSQIGVVSGEELAEFYGVAKVPEDKILGQNKEAKALFMNNPEKKFKTPLWYYLLKEAEESASHGVQLGEAGSHLVGEVLAGAIYYGNQFAFNDKWESSIPGVTNNQVTLRNIIDFASGKVACPAWA